VGHSKVVATALNQTLENNKSKLLPLRHSGKFTAYSLNILLVSCLSATAVTCATNAVSAADFSHAQHVFVPPTSIPRHFDSESLNYGNATGDSPDIYPTHDLPAGGASTRTFTQNGRSFKKTIDSGSKQSQARSAPTSAANVDAPPAMNAFVNQAKAKSQTLMKQGKLAAAEEMLQTDLKAVPKSQTLQTELANVRVARAKYALKIGNTALATQHAEAALLVQPNNAAAKSVLAEISSKETVTTSGITDHLTKAKVLIGQASYAQANAEIQAAIQIKDTSDSHVALGDLSFKQGNVETARTEYTKALQMDPESGPALRQYGIFKLHNNDVVGANKDLSRALIINGKDKEAATALQKIWHDEVTKNPTSANAHLGLARAYQLSEDLTLAQAEYREVVKLEPQHPSLPSARESFKLALAKQESVKCLQAAKTLEDAGALTEAHQKATEAVNISPSCVSARLYQGAICEKLNLYSEAHDAYMAALKYDPKNAIAARHLRALQHNANSAELSAAPEGTGTGITTAAAAGSNSSTPNVPAGMYVFKGWQFGHPLASSSSNGSDAGAQTSTAYGGARTASYSYASNSPPQMGNATQAMASNATTALNSAGMPTAPQMTDPAAPMPLQGTPPVQNPAASTASHVAAFANFFSSLREATTNTKNQTRSYENAMNNAFGNGSSSSLGGSSYGGSASALAGLGSGATAAANLGSTPLPAVSTPSQSSISSVLAQAAQAVAGAGGNPSQTSAGSSAGSPTAAGASGTGSSTGNSSNTVSINVNGTNIQISNPNGSATSVSTSDNSSANGGQSLSGATWDAAPQWLKNKFPNMTQQDFTTIAGQMKGTLKSRLQALAAKQKAAAAGTGPQVTAAQAAQTLASALPPNVTINGQSASAALSKMVNENVAGNVLPSAPATAALSQDGLLAPPAAGLPSAAGVDLNEQEILSRAGQDAPTLAPPEVVPSGSTGFASTIAPTTTLASVPVMPTTTTTTTNTAASTTEPVLRPQLPTTASSTASGTTSSTSTGLQGRAQSLAALPSSSTMASTPMNSSGSPTDSNSSDNSNASVKLELQGFTPTPTGIRLRVVIKNSRSKSLPLPDAAKAVIHMPGQPDKEAKISFTAKEVIAGGLVQGTVKVPGHDLNPAADLVLPNFLPTTFADRDVHLTVPISALMK
jgi:tetratricopeptide (TPR) repeat protein